MFQQPVLTTEITLKIICTEEEAEWLLRGCAEQPYLLMTTETMISDPGPTGLSQRRIVDTTVRLLGQYTQYNIIE